MQFILQIYFNFAMTKLYNCFSNDPALLINQLHLNSNSSSSVYKEKDMLKEKEYQVGNLKAIN